MIRIISESIALFLLPTAVYLVYMLMVRKDGGGAQQVMNEAPLVALFVAGLAVIGTTLYVFADRDGDGRGDKYEPPIYKDGQITPGRVK